MSNFTLWESLADTASSAKDFSRIIHAVESVPNEEARVEAAELIGSITASRIEVGLLPESESGDALAPTAPFTFSEEAMFELGKFAEDVNNNGNFVPEIDQ